MKGVVCRFFKRDGAKHEDRLVMVTVYKTLTKRKVKRKKTVTKTETRTSKERQGELQSSESKPKLTDQSSARSNKPWDVDKKEVVNVDKDVSEKVEEELITAYQIVVENDRNRENQHYKWETKLPPSNIMIDYFRRAITVNWQKIAN